MNIRKYLSNIRDYDLDDALSVVGLQKRSSGDWVFPMLAGLGAGMAIGAGLAFFLTPYRGDEAREKVKKGAQDAQRMLSEKVSMLSDKVSQLVAKEESTAAGARPITPTTTQNVGTSTTGSRTY
jgi:hypothetical protein